MRRWLGVVLLVTACVGGTDEASPPPPSTVAGATVSGPQSSPSAPATDADPPVVPTGYDLVQATVTEADGTVCEVCLWLADTAEQRRSGLMHVTDLGDGDGMAFRYPNPHTGTFWMKNTLLPLSIAFFAPDGTYLDAFDMEPCTTADCPTYPTAPDFLVAIETTRGDLAELGIGPGSTLVLTDAPCALHE